MASVIATGAVPTAPEAPGLGVLGQSLLQFAQLREQAKQREASNAFAQALQTAAQPHNVDGTMTEPSPIAKAFSGMDTGQLAAYLRANPQLIRDPAKLSKLFNGGEDYEYHNVNGTLVRVGKTSGKTAPVFTSPDKNKPFDFKVVNNALYKINPRTGEFERVANEADNKPTADFGFESVNGTLFRTNKRTGEAQKLYTVDQQVKPQDALSKLTQDYKDGLISREDFTARRQLLTTREGSNTVQTVGGPGGSVLNKATGEVMVPGRLNVVDKSGQEKTVAFSTKDELAALTAKFNSGELTETSKGGRQPGSELGDKTHAQLQAKRQENAKSQLSKETGGLIQFANTLKQVKSAPTGSFGARGNIAKRLAGFVGQVDPQSADALAGLISGGASEQDLTNLRTNARSLIQAVIPAVTGENGDRISEAERALAEDALSVFSNASDKTQAQAALGQLMALKLAGMERLRAEAGLPQEFNYEKLDDVKRLYSRYVNELGLDPRTAKLAIKTQRDVRREIAPLFAQPGK